MATSKRPARSRGPSKGKEKEHAGAGTRWVRETLDRPGPSNWAEMLARQNVISAADTPDELLESGIAEYTFVRAAEGGILGKGKFSTVYKVVAPDGRYLACKHTPLYPHHPLIAARLLREPTLLAQLPPHPCLIGIEGWVRTQGHFYLIEQYPENHIPLPDFPLPLQPRMARYIMDQLVSVLRDCLHSGGRVCHRDIKPENILIHPETGDLLLLDLGLGTRYSASEKKLTTCCGSPAFHSPEIVHALSLAAGEVTYMGPELDIWCLALTMLSILLQVRFPLGTHHTSLAIMEQAVRECLEELDEACPISSLQPDDHDDWTTLRKGIEAFLLIDGEERMSAFAAYEVGNGVKGRLAAFQQLGRDANSVRSTSFMQTEVRYTIPVYLEFSKCMGSAPLVLLNPERQPPRKVESYIRYLLRCAGIVYHQLPPTSDPMDPDFDVNDGTTYQLVIPYSAALELPKVPASEPAGTNSPRSWLSNIFPFRPALNRSSSLPPKQRAASPVTPVGVPAVTQKGEGRFLSCYLRIEFEVPHLSSPPSPTASLRHGPMTGASSRASSVHGLGLEARLEALTVNDSIGPLRPRSHSRPAKNGAGLGVFSPLSQSRDVSPAPATVDAARARPIGGRTASGRSASLIPRTGGPTRILVHISDERARAVIEQALSQSPAPQPDAEKNTIGGSQQVSVPIPVVRASQVEDSIKSKAEEEEERGRPRSKEDKNTPGLLIPAPGGGTTTRVTTAEEQRERTLSLLGLFGAGQSPTSRSVSVPPPLHRGMLAM